MALSCEKLAGSGHRFARPLNVRQVTEIAAKLKLTYFSPEGYRIKSWAMNSDQRVRIILSFGDLAETSAGTRELIAHAEFVGQKGRVQVPVNSEHFLADATKVRNYVLAMANILMAGAEPFSVYRIGGSFSFYFSSEPDRSLTSLLDGFILPERRGWDNSSRVFLLHPESREGKVREVEIFDAWIVNRVAELEMAQQVIDPAGIAHEAGVTEKRIITQIGRINDLRRKWEIPPLPRHPSFLEIESTVKQLRRELIRWPSLTDVAQKLGVYRPALQAALDLYNQQRCGKNQPPLHLA